MRPSIIVNPRSGGGRAGRTLQDICGLLERRLGPVDVLLTERAGHGIDLAREAARQGRHLVVAVGGDGTMNEVANGVLDAGRDAAAGIAVGYVGLGTGGDFRRTLGIEHRLDAYLDAIAGGRESTIDVGKLRYRAHDGTRRARWFVNILSAGMGGLVDQYVAQTSKSFGGKAAYLLASARALLTCERGRVHCRVGLGDERSEHVVDTLMIAICNGRYFGSGMHVAPMARPDDGRFEVVAMDAPSKLAFATFSRKIYAGAHLDSPGVTCFGCDRIELELQNEGAREAFLLDVDGEALGGLPVAIELVPKALRVRF